MKVTAALMFYAEPPEELDAQVRALGGFCDRLAAVHGHWNGFPVPDGYSEAEECATVVKAAADAGLELNLQSGLGFPGELSHRNWTLASALKDTDWLYLMDADERVLSHKGVRDELDHMTCDVGTVEFFTAEGPEKPLTTWEQPGGTTEQRRLFRANPNMRFEVHHWWLVDDVSAYWGEVAGRKFAPAAKTSLKVEHRTCLRPAARWATKRTYAKKRDADDIARGYEL
jgi:hypothetical protein